MAAPDLKDVLEQKRVMLEKMLGITQQFSMLLSADRIEDFAAALKNRESLIVQIDSLDKTGRQLEAQHGPGYEEIKKKAQALIREILKLDEENAALAQEKISLYKQQIKSFNDNKKGIGNYTMTGQEDAFFVDAKK